MASSDGCGAASGEVQFGARHIRRRFSCNAGGSYIAADYFAMVNEGSILLIGIAPTMPLLTVEKLVRYSAY